jgi:hypothetical protein
MRVSLRDRLTKTLGRAPALRLLSLVVYILITHLMVRYFADHADGLAFLRSRRTE